MINNNTPSGYNVRRAHTRGSNGEFIGAKTTRVVLMLDIDYDEDHQLLVTSLLEVADKILVEISSTQTNRGPEVVGTESPQRA